MKRSLCGLPRRECPDRTRAITQRSHITGQAVSAVASSSEEAYETDWHEHCEFMALVAMGGGLVLRTEPEGIAYRLMPGTLALVRPEIFHATAALRVTQRHYAVYIDPEYVWHILRDIGVPKNRPEWNRPVIWEASNALVSMLRLQSEIQEAHDIPGQQLRQDAMSRSLAAECIFQTLSTPKPAPSATKRDRLLMLDIQSFINDHLAEDLKIDEIAQRFLLSRRHLVRLFKEHTGYTVLEFTNLCRVRRARQLLADARVTPTLRCAPCTSSVRADGATYG